MDRFPVRARVAIALVAALLASAGLAAPATEPAFAAPPTPKVETDPPLFPDFNSPGRDHVVRCETGTPVLVTPGSDTKAWLDGERIPSGSATPVALEPGQSMTLSAARDRKGKVRKVRCLPPDFPDFTVATSGARHAQWYVVTPLSLQATGKPYVAFFDAFGVPVWWMRPDPAPIDASVLPDGTVAWARYYGGGFGREPEGAYEVHNLDGTLVTEWQTVGTPTDHHDLLMLPNGNHLILSYRPREPVDLSPWDGPDDALAGDAEVQELTPDGTLVSSWNSAEHIPLAEGDRWFPLGVIAHPAPRPDGRSIYDPWHVNSVEPDGDGFIISLRHTDAVYRVDSATGAIDWKLGGTTTSESLEIVGGRAAETNFGGQHDARRLPDGTVSLHDNGTFRNRPPRIVRYRIDEDAGTATLVEEIVESTGASSVCCGGARQLPGGHWVVSWGGLPRFQELTADGSAALTIDFAGGLFSYRAYPVLPGVLSRADLRAGMDAMYPRYRTR